MIVFLNTSSVFKLYHQEVGTEALLDFLAQDIEAIYLSELAILEFRSAIWKKVRTDEINEAVANTVIGHFQRDLTHFCWVALNHELLEQAQVLLMKYGKSGLRTLDAIQLACALQLKEKPNICFISADKLLQSFFRQEGLAVFSSSS